MLNNVGCALAVEKLLGIEVPERCQYYRVILGELARIADHLTCNGATAMELGAFTPFLWLLKVRDWVWDILERETGARMTHSFGRIGGMAEPPTATFKDDVLHLIPELRQGREGNGDHASPKPHLPRPHAGRRHHDQGAGHCPTGSPARGSAPRGSPTTCARPIPTWSTTASTSTCRSASDGDNYDRFMVRLEEIRQSVRIIEQAIEQMPDDGPINVDDPRIVLPRKGRGLHDDRSHHRALQARHGRAANAQGRSVQLHRRRQRRARLLHRLGRQRHALPGAHPSAVLVQPRGVSRNALSAE